MTKAILGALALALFVGGAAQAQDKVVMRINFTPWGMHAQYYSLSSSFAPEPRLSFKYQFRENQSFTIGYGLHHQIQPLPLVLE